VQDRQQTGHFANRQIAERPFEGRQFTKRPLRNDEFLAKIAILLKINVTIYFLAV
jgi:hypothetical protein